MQFSKMQGVGNDFVVLNADALPAETDWAELAIRLCARRVGVGADGLLVVWQAPPAPNSGGARGENSGPGASSPTPCSPAPQNWGGGAAFAMRMFNPDGTEDMCGNGLRCVGLWAHRAGWLGDKTEFVIATKEGPKAAQIVEADADGRAALLRVDMGLPHFTPAAIPFCAHDTEQVVNFPLTVDGMTLSITALNTGSTHTVIFGDAPAEATFQHLSPLIENHPLFPERTTVLWATPEGENTFGVRIWERGVGETLGCGTGACAVGVAAQLTGRISTEAPIYVVSKGGTLRIDWPGEGRPIEMSGPAQFVFEGES
ncbi:MAG: diaminopimelate epimerase [Armatimonadota bacterium]|nr:diaminopimelate epimerase [Armatimonadota bacterium]